MAGPPRSIGRYLYTAIYALLRENQGKAYSSVTQGLRRWQLVQAIKELVSRVAQILRALACILASTIVAIKVILAVKSPVLKQRLIVMLSTNLLLQQEKRLKDGRKPSTLRLQNTSSATQPHEAEFDASQADFVGSIAGATSNLHTRLGRTFGPQMKSWN